MTGPVERVPHVVDLNAERKRRAGLADDGRCGCGRYRLVCVSGCLETTVCSHGRPGTDCEVCYG